MSWECNLIVENCTGCGICLDVCSNEAIKQTREMAYPKPIPGKCTGCKECVEECPFNAIEVRES